MERLKELAVNFVKLGLVDVEAARGPKASGRGLNQAADSMGVSWGSVLVQLDVDLRHYIILGVLSGTLTISQQAWVAWEKELYAQMKSRKGYWGITQGFPLTMLTDHENIVRVSKIPVERLQERIFRWWSEATRGQAHFEHRSGKSLLISIADGISRNVVERDIIPRLDENPELFKCNRI